jgi:hypothetical protein
VQIDVAVPQHPRLPVSAMPDAQRHIAHVDMLELEASNTSTPARTPSA